MAETRKIPRSDELRLPVKLTIGSHTFESNLVYDPYQFQQMMKEDPKRWTKQSIQKVLTKIMFDGLAAKVKDRQDADELFHIGETITDPATMKNSIRVKVELRFVEEKLSTAIEISCEEIADLKTTVGPIEARDALLWGLMTQLEGICIEREVIKI